MHCIWGGVFSGRRALLGVGAAIARGCSCVGTAAAPLRALCLLDIAPRDRWSPHEGYSVRPPVRVRWVAVASLTFGCFGLCLGASPLAVAAAHPSCNPPKKSTGRAGQSDTRPMQLAFDAIHRKTDTPNAKHRRAASVSATVHPPKSLYPPLASVSQTEWTLCQSQRTRLPVPSTQNPPRPALQKGLSRSA